MKPTPPLFLGAIGLALTSLFSTGLIHAAPKRGLTPEIVEKNLALIPETDPVAESIPKVVDSLQGKHPRVLFTDAEIEILKARIPNDPILKGAHDALSTWSKRFKLSPAQVAAMTTNDTPALSMGNGQVPSLAYAYALDKDPVVLKAIEDALRLMIAEEHWGNVKEMDSSMGTACLMMMTAVLWDSVYNEMDPELRTAVANKLLVHARRLFYLGHKQLAVDMIKYWQQDPQPNHRWYRMRGLAACVLAIADEPGIQAGYLLEQAKNEMDFLMKWYPEDGDCHEGSGYQSFGFRSLVESARMFDHVLGTEYLKHPGFRNAWKQQVYYWLPGSNRTISFGDANNTPIRYQYDFPPFMIGPALTRDKDAQAALLKIFRENSKDRKGEQAYPWTLLEFYDPTVGEGDISGLPTSHLFEDLGAATMRDSWEDDAVVLAFKCGPYGGYGLNEYRHEVLGSDGKPHYVNLAHDDPDANSFAMAVAGDFVFHPGTYSTKKMTNTNSTITVDGKGQVMEADAYTQPVPDYDMRKLSYLTGWKEGEDGSVIIQGEASDAYRAYEAPEAEEIAFQAALEKAQADGTDAPPKPAKTLSESTLDRFRRTAIYRPGEYVLLFDDIVAKGEHEIMWRGTVPRAAFVDPAEGLCKITTSGGKEVPFQMLSNQPIQGAIDYLPLMGRFGSDVAHQLQFPVKTDAVKYAALVDPWDTGVRMTFKDAGDTSTVTVKGKGFEDTWTIKQAKDNQTASTVEGTRDGKPLMGLTESDKVPRP